MEDIAFQNPAVLQELIAGVPAPLYRAWPRGLLKSACIGQIADLLRLIVGVRDSAIQCPLLTLSVRSSPNHYMQTAGEEAEQVLGAK